MTRTADTCEHGKPFPRYANCVDCREAIEREDAEADALAHKLLANTEVYDASGGSSFSDDDDPTKDQP